MKQTIRPMIEQEITDRVQGQELFTAFDITSSIEGASHGFVKTVVKDLLETGQMTGYTRTPQALGPQGDSAWVYHATGVDPSTYGKVPTAVAQTLIAAPIAAAITPPAAVVDPADA